MKACNDGDRIHGLDEQENIKQWECDRDDKRQNEKGKEILFPDLLLIKYINNKIDDMVRARRYIEWCGDNNIPLDYGGTSVPHHALAPERILNPSNQENPTLNNKSYFTNSSPVNKKKLQPRDYSFEECFDMEADFAGIRNDPYSRSLEEYTAVFDNEIEQLATEYELRIGKKGYILDDIWEKCKQFHGGTPYLWHDRGHGEAEK
ncbi:hypothetical protein Tco_0678976 [Tanacetum coccineum]|uniref:Uncharacterized protein n=1 Tax=Tanacetum coccineum TaxID=301880 RepID=A0ABQ4XGP9_9ASTR